MLNFLASALFLASGATGSWVFSMAGPGGQMVDAALTMKCEDGKLTGTFVFNGSRELKVEEGTCTEQELRFTIRRNRPQGGTMTYSMKGALDGDTAKGTATMEGTAMDWTAKRK